MTEVKNKSEDFNFAEKFTKMADNNSRQNKVASEGRKMNLYIFNKCNIIQHLIFLISKI